MELYCEKQPKSTTNNCKKYLVVVDQGVPQIFYFRLYINKNTDEKYKFIEANEEIINGLYNLDSENKLSDIDLNYLVDNIKNTYKTLKKYGKEKTTLLTLTKYFSKKSTHAVHLGNGILMEDESMVFFYDYSDIISGKLNTIFEKGGLL